MRRVLILAFALLAETAAFGAISFPSSCSGTTSCTPSGTSSPGDAEFVFAYRQASATAPTNPAGWTSVTSGSSATGANRSWRLSCRVLQTSATYAVSGTFTNATNMGLTVVRSSGATSTANCATDFIQPLSTVNSVSSATATYNALTTNGTSDLPLLLMGSSTSGNTCTPSGATVIAGATTGDVRISQANAVGNWSSTTCSITSSVTTEMVVGIHAVPTLTACSSNCPTMVTYKQSGMNPATTTPLAQNEYYTLPQPVLTNNTLACATRWNGTAITATVTADGTTMTTGPTANDGTSIVTGYYLAAATGKQHVKVALSAGAGSLQIICAQIQGVPTSSPLDVSVAAQGTTGPLIQAGSMTTTVDNDIIPVFAFINGDNVILHDVTQYSVPVDNWTPMGGANSGVNGAFGYYMVWGSHGAINPTILPYQATNDVWGIVAMAFKQSAGAGTLATGAYIKRDVVIVPDATTFSNQFPCDGNLQVAMTAGDTGLSTLSKVVDSDANGLGNLNGGAGTGAGTWDRFAPGAGRPQAGVATNSTCTNNKTRTVTFTVASATNNPYHLYDMVGFSTTPYDTSATTSTGGATSSNGAVQVSSTQTTKALSSTTCANDANSNSTLNFTPSTASGMALFSEYTATGPDCGASGTGNVFTSTWFEGEDDSIAVGLEASSGNGNQPYSSASAQTVTINWANALSSAASPYGILIMPFKAAPSTGRLRGVVVGQ